MDILEVLKQFVETDSIAVGMVVILAFAYVKYVKPMMSENDNLKKNIATKEDLELLKSSLDFSKLLQCKNEFQDIIVSNTEINKTVLLKLNEIYTILDTISIALIESIRTIIESELSKIINIIPEIESLKARIEDVKDNHDTINNKIDINFGMLLTQFDRMKLTIDEINSIVGSLIATLENKNILDPQKLGDNLLYFNLISQLKDMQGQMENQKKLLQKELGNIKKSKLSQYEED